MNSITKGNALEFYTGLVQLNYVRNWKPTKAKQTINTSTQIKSSYLNSFDLRVCPQKVLHDMKDFVLIVPLIFIYFNFWLFFVQRWLHYIFIHIYIYTPVQLYFFFVLLNNKRNSWLIYRTYNSYTEVQYTDRGHCDRFYTSFQVAQLQL